ncbi:MAG: hypothetical protein IKB73_05310 [Ruminococcus sp.]|nr:hypothetical protein [Ruminococcus sp.]
MATYRHAKGPNFGQIAIIALIVVVALSIISGAAFAIHHFSSSKEKVEETKATQATTPATVDEAPTEAPTEDPELEYEKLAKDYLSKMTEDEKIYQMLIVTPKTLTGVSGVTEAGPVTQSAIETYPVGGILYDSENFENSTQTIELIKNSQSFAKTPMFIAVNEEGGENSPVSSTLTATKLNAMSTYASEGEAKAQENAATIAKDIKAYGFNMNLSPIANITGDNAFGADSATASPLVAAAVKGYEEKKVISTLKSFPTLEDTTDTADKLKADTLLPFMAGIDSNAGFVMLSDCKATAIDAQYPAYMSQNIVSELLIKDLKFDGVIMTPALSDSLTTSTYQVADIVKNSINAGVNVFLSPSDANAYAEAIKTAVANKEITQQQIDNSVTKILKLKFKYGIISKSSESTPMQAATEASTYATQTSSETTALMQ